ncbi:MAG: type II secretion system F family protein [Thermodesulforhabdaceae bacterium]
MPLIRYKAFDPGTGSISVERDDCEDIRELIARLRTEGKLLLSYKRERRLLPEKKVSRLEMAEMCRNLSFLISAGVPIIQGLEDIAAMTEHKVLARTLRRVVTDIRSGMSFAESLEQHKKVFPPIVRNLAAIGEATGKLETAMSEAAAHLTRVHEIITQSNRAMIYPAFVVSAIGIALGVWFFYVLPKIFAVFQEMHIRLPLATRILMEVVKILKQYWLVAPALVALIAIWIALARIYEPIGYRTEQFLLKVPILRNAKRLSIMAFFFEYLSLILEAGIDILTGLKIMAESVESRIMKRIIPSISEDIQAGRMFSESCDRTKFFKPMEIRIMRIGEESGKLPEQLKILGDFYYKKLIEFVEALPKIIEPLLITVVGIVFLIIVVALMGPVYELISAIGKAY